MIQARIDGADRAARRMRRLERNAAYSTSRALNAMAKGLQRHTIEHILPKAFTLAGKTRKTRGAPWWRPGTKLGFNLRFARRDNPTASLSSRADWLPLHESGGRKGPKSGRTVGIPTDEVRPTKFDVVPKSKRPSKLKATGKTFIKQIGGELGIWRRVGGKKRRRLKLLYMLRPTVEIRPTLSFYREARRWVKTKGRIEFTKEFRRVFSESQNQSN